MRRALRGVRWSGFSGLGGMRDDRSGRMAWFACKDGREESENGRSCHRHTWSVVPWTNFLDPDPGSDE